MQFQSVFYPILNFQLSQLLTLLTYDVFTRNPYFPQKVNDIGVRTQRNILYYTYMYPRRIFHKLNSVPGNLF